MTAGSQRKTLNKLNDAFPAPLNPLELSTSQAGDLI